MLVGDGEVVERRGVGRVELGRSLPAVDRLAPEAALRDVDAELDLRFARRSCASANDGDAATVATHATSSQQQSRFHEVISSATIAYPRLRSSKPYATADREETSAIRATDASPRFTKLGRCVVARMSSASDDVKPRDAIIRAARSSSARYARGGDLLVGAAAAPVRGAVMTDLLDFVSLSLLPPGAGACAPTCAAPRRSARRGRPARCSRAPARRSRDRPRTSRPCARGRRSAAPSAALRSPRSPGATRVIPRRWRRSPIRRRCCGSRGCPDALSAPGGRDRRIARRVAVRA